MTMGALQSLPGSW